MTCSRIRFYKHKSLLQRTSFVFLLLTLAFIKSVNGQSFWMQEDGNPSGFWKVDYSPCEIEEEFHAMSIYNDLGFTVTPNGILYGINDASELYKVDTNTGAWTYLFQL